MSDEEESNNENEENEDEEDKEEGEGEENEDDEGEGEENEDDEEKEDEEGEEKEDEEGEEKEDEEEEEDEEDDKKKKKGKKGKKKKEKEEKKENETEEQKPQQSSKFSEDKLHPSKEIKMDLNLNNLNSSNSNNIYFNGNDITLANIAPPKKTTLQLLSEISTEMDTLSTHLEEVLPKENPLKYNVMYPISNTVLSPNIAYPNDNQDLEIKKLIEKANSLTSDSILNKKREENGENKVKTFEDKCCQSDDEIEYSYHQQLEENKSREEEDYYNNNYNGDYNRRRFPYDPYKHLGYYNELRNNNEFRRRPLIYTQRENYNNNNNNFRGNDLRFERYKPGSVSQAMDILLDNK